eukprot:gene12403-biopygen459
MEFHRIGNPRKAVAFVRRFSRPRRAPRPLPRCRRSAVPSYQKGAGVPSERQPADSPLGQDPQPDRTSDSPMPPDRAFARISLPERRTV